jgi:hypothetical protein
LRAAIVSGVLPFLAGVARWGIAQVGNVDDPPRRTRRRKGFEMDILATRSGGFTGFTEQLGPTDVGKLPLPTAEKISQIVGNISFFELPGDLGEVPSPKDFTFGMRVVDGERQHEVGWNSSSKSPHIADLQQIITLVESAGVEWRLEGGSP